MDRLKWQNVGGAYLSGIGESFEALKEGLEVFIVGFCRIVLVRIAA